MAPRTIQITKGPNHWNFVLATHDVHPSNAMGLRRPDFTMANGLRFHIELLGLAWEPYPSLDPWTIRGKLAGSLPKGYSVNEPGKHEYSDIIEFKYDPDKRQGSVDLYIVSPCHRAVISSALSDGLLVGYCGECNEPVVRRRTQSGIDEWLDGRSPWSDEGYFTPVSASDM